MNRKRSPHKRKLLSRRGQTRIGQTLKQRVYEQDHLFVSYAWEDSAFAEWLTLKLTAAGYKVWCDKVKLLGGESYPTDIDHAIKHRAFRVLALLSQHSLAKPNPKKERTLALNLARERNTDFLIPLNVDGLRPDQLDWMTSDLTFIPFHSSWAEGFAALLKKLSSVRAPCDPCAGRNIVSNWIASQDKPANRTEKVWSNLLPIREIPATIYQFEATFTDENIKTASLNWPFYRQNPTTAWAFSPPDASLDISTTVKSAIRWPDTPMHENLCLSHVVSYLVKRSLVLHCHARGMWFVQGEKNSLFFPQGRMKGDKIAFNSYRGRKSYIKVAGERTFYRSGLSERNRYHLSPVFRTALYEYPEPVMRVGLRLHLTKLDGASLEPARIISRRKGICKSWWNHEWLSRLLAVCHWISDGQPAFTVLSTTDGSLTLSGIPLSFTASVGIDETKLQPVPKLDPSELIIDDGAEECHPDDEQEDQELDENEDAL